MAKFKLWNDILTEAEIGSGKKIYSQGRVYLCWSIIAYYITLGIVSYKALTHKDIEEESLKLIIESLQWVILLMAGYVFGGKGIEVIKSIFGKTPPTSQTPPADQNKPQQQAPPEEGII